MRAGIKGAVERRNKMLRRITALITLIGLTTIYFSAIPASAAASATKSQKRNSKLAPELDSASNANDLVRDIIQTKGRPTAAHDDAIKANGGAGDRDGHGTGVASVAAGNGSASGGYGASYVGIAPDASILDLKVLDANGVGTTSATLDAINWAIVNQKRYNVRVINLSLGAPVRESFHKDPLCKAVERAVLNGIVVVAAAGNNGHTDEIISHKDNGDPIYRPAYGTID